MAVDSMNQLIQQLFLIITGLLASLKPGPYNPSGGSGGSTSFPAPGRCTGACSGVHDPSLVRRDDGTFFRFCTHNRITIATAPSIQGPWTERGPALQDGSKIKLPGNTDLWAPDVFYYKPTYYLFYSVSEQGSQQSDIGVATSPTMDQGSWTDYGSLGIPDSPTKSYNKIDANLLQPSTAPGQAPTFLMSFGSYWHDVYQIPLDNPPLTVATSVPSSSNGSGGNNNVAAQPTPVNLEYNGTSPGPGVSQDKAPLAPSEGSYQFWWKVGGKVYYYLFFSSGQCCDFDRANMPPAGEEYKIMVCRSERPDGDFVDRKGKKCTDNGGTIVLGSSGNMFAPGGQGVLFNKDLNSPVVYYHYIDKSIGYDNDQFQFGWNKLDFKSGWPVAVQS